MSLSRIAQFFDRVITISDKKSEEVNIVCDEKFGSISKTGRHRDVSNLAIFYAFIKKENNSTIFWSLAAGLHHYLVLFPLGEIGL